MENLLIIVLPICLAASFLCAGMEAGVFALGRWRIAQQMRAGKKRAARLYQYLQHPENFLWTILVGNTFGAFFALWIIAIALLEVFGDRPLAFFGTFLGAVLLFYTFCDLLPKMLFGLFPNRLSLLLSAPFRFLHLAFSPIVAVIEGLANLLLWWTGGKVFTGHVFSTRHELRLLLQDPSQDLTTEERGMINRVLDLQSISVRQIAVPLQRYPSVERSDSVRTVMERFRRSEQNLIAVLTGGAPKNRRVAGFLNIKNLLFQENLLLDDPVSKHLTGPIYIEEDLRVQEALRRLHRSGQRVAVVLGRDRRELGLITLEEILKVVLGEVKI